MFSARMTEEISPNIMFFGIRCKDSQTHVHGCWWLQMGAVGCRSTGVQGNKVKRGRNTPAGRVLQCITTDKNPRKSGRTVTVTGEDHGEVCQERKRFEVQKGCICLIWGHQKKNKTNNCLGANQANTTTKHQHVKQSKEKQKIRDSQACPRINQCKFASSVTCQTKQVVVVFPHQVARWGSWRSMGQDVFCSGYCAQQNWPRLF